MVGLVNLVLDWTVPSDAVKLRASRRPVMAETGRVHSQARTGKQPT